MFRASLQPISIPCLPSCAGRRVRPIHLYSQLIGSNGMNLEFESKSVLVSIHFFDQFFVCGFYKAIASHFIVLFVMIARRRCAVCFHACAIRYPRCLCVHNYMPNFVNGIFLETLLLIFAFSQSQSVSVSAYISFLLLLLFDVVVVVFFFFSVFSIRSLVLRKEFHLLPFVVL